MKKISVMPFGLVIAAAALQFAGTAQGVPLYEWNFDQNSGTGTTVTPTVTPNGLATDGGVLTMAQLGGTAIFTPANLFTASGGGISGQAGDYAFDNSASVSNNSNPGGVAYSTGVAATNSPNSLNAMPNLVQYTMTLWVKPTTAELSQQSRLMQIGTAVSEDDAPASEVYVALNAGKVQAGGGGQSNAAGVGNTLIANAWNFIAVEVDLAASNIYYDPAMRTATGNLATAEDSMVLYQGDSTSNTYAYTYQAGFANGTTSFASQNDYVQLLNRTTNGTRAFQGQGDDFEIYNSLLSTAQLQSIIATDTASVPEPMSLGIILLSGLLLLRRRHAISVP